MKSRGGGGQGDFMMNNCELTVKKNHLHVSIISGNGGGKA